MRHFLRKTKSTLQLLSKGEIERIHEQSLYVLQHCGIEVNHDKALKLLDEGGAQVDYSSQRVKIPPDLVTCCLKTVPEKITLAARNPEKDCILEPFGRPYSRNGGGSDYTLDLKTDEIRPLLASDMKDYFKLMDALENIDFVAAVFGHDLPIEGRDILVLREMLDQTDKHIHIRAYSKESLQYMFQMAEIVAGSKEELRQRPLISLLEAPVSPLKFIDISVEGLWLCGEYGIPLELCIMPICGATGPMTMAGNSLLINVELLGCVVLSQLSHPGAPLEHAPRPMIMNMSNGIGLTGSVEGIKMSIAGAQMAHYYNIPVSLHGPWTDSMTFDGQSTMERTNYASMSSLAGANVLSGSGMLQQGLLVSLVQLAIDDEINSALVSTQEGFGVDDERLGAEVISRVGPGGNFLEDEHTLKYLRTERHQPDILYRGTREAWQADGAKSFEQRARDKVNTILEEHQRPLLPEDKEKELNNLVQDALRLLKK
ncbi:MAG: trimethylamine methyltransferase family protein [Sedimentisphaerales bacterium]|nr:trimethylamine methyltransferase family protein [Sedimentisphaerales bacterium]